jgi:hypothetical protein
MHTCMHPCRHYSSLHLQWRCVAPVEFITPSQRVCLCLIVCMYVDDLRLYACTYVFELGRIISSRHMSASHPTCPRASLLSFCGFDFSAQIQVRSNTITSKCADLLDHGITGAGVHVIMSHEDAGGDSELVLFHQNGRLGVDLPGWLHKLGIVRYQTVTIVACRRHSTSHILANPCCRHLAPHCSHSCSQWKPFAHCKR